MPTADTIKNLTISGNARVLTDTGLAASTDFNILNQTNPFNIVIKNNLEIEQNTGRVISEPLKVTNITSLNDGITVGSVGDGISDIAVSGVVNFNPDLLGDTASVPANTGSFNKKARVKAFKFTISADADKIIKELRIKFEGFTASTPEDSVFIHDETVTENSSGEITSVTFVVASNIKRPIFSGINLVLHGVAGTPRPTEKKISNLVFGPSTAPIKETTRTIEVYGDVGARYRIIVSEVGNNSNKLLDKDGVRIPPRAAKDVEQAQNTVKHRITIPATATNKSYQIIIKPLEDTILSGQLGDFHANAKPLLINQIVNPNFKLAFTSQTSPSPGYSALADTIVKGKANTSGKELEHLVFEQVAVAPFRGERKSAFEIQHVIVTDTGSFTFDSSKLVKTNSNLFQTGTISGTPDYTAHAFQPRLVDLDFQGKVSTTSSSNDTFTLDVRVVINAFEESDITYQINLAEFLTHGS
jgi:hypothetical protein